jgi:DNA polymerase-3 subunit alpha
MLRRLCNEGAIKKYGALTPEVQSRLDYELKVIESKGFASYFLIVWDFVHYARAGGILCGARGSGVGCLVAYVLDLHAVDPLEYDLLFERFMDPSRNEMPDIDIDLCQEGRGKVIEYVRNKYGKDNVAQIITFGTMAAKAAIRDVGRVLGLPLAVVDRVSKLVPQELKMTLDTALEREPELRQMVEGDKEIRNLYDLARRLEGLARHAGMHAAGVVIADAPLVNYVPLYKSPEGDVMTQWDMEMVEKVGLLKMDMLGLRTYTMIDRACRLIERNHGVTVDLNALDITDQKVYELFCRAETRGIFQFESGGMRDVLAKMKPNGINDLIAAAALYRPGPMEMIAPYCDRKHGREPVPAVHPLMDDVLRDTYGIMVYQEQVMRIFNRLGSMPLSDAYKLIKAISKKKADVIEAKKPGFLDGCVKNGVPRGKAAEIFDLILKFGGYGFNKSHSTQYAIVAFWTAWLKTYYPVEFMAALLSTEMGNTDKVVDYIHECKGMGVPVMPPDVNESDVDFTVVRVQGSGERGEGTANKDAAAKPARAPDPQPLTPHPSHRGIRFGLGAVKGVGEKAVESIIAARNREGGRFRSLFHFCESVDTRAVNRSVVEALIRCGAFDSTSTRRAALSAALESALDIGSKAQADRKAGQLGLFGGGSESKSAPRPEPPLPNVPEPPRQETLKMEKETLGFYVSSHPLAEHAEALEKFASHPVSALPNLSDGTAVLLGGLVSAVRTRIAKSGRSEGQKWAIFRLEDLAGGVDCLAFAEQYAKFRDLIAEDKLVVVKGVVDFKREEPSVRVNEMMPLEEAAPRFCRRVVLRMNVLGSDVAKLKRLETIVRAHPGDCPVYLEFLTPDRRRATLRIAPTFSVLPDARFVTEMGDVLTKENVLLFGGPPGADSGAGLPSGGYPVARAGNGGGGYGGGGYSNGGSNGGRGNGNGGYRNGGR